MSSASPDPLPKETGRFNAEAAYLRLALDSHAIVSITDPSGHITYVNDKFCEVSGFSREEILGKTHCVVRSDEHPQSFFESMWKVITANRIWRGEVCNRRKDGRLYWVDSTIVPFLDPLGNIYQYVSIRTDITHQKQVERLLAAMSRAQSEILSETNPERVFSSLLSAVLSLTDSPFGLMGEVLADPQQRDKLNLFAVTSKTMESTGGDNCLQHMTHSMDGCGDHPLFVQTIRSGKPVILNNRKSLNDELPGHHPQLEHFLCLPFLRGDQTVGLLALANRPSGYDQDLLSLLEPMTNACASMIEGIRNERHRQHALEALRVAKEDAEKADRAKTEFLSSMSHELRTPLNAIIGFSQLMETDQVDVLCPSHQENVEQILKAGWHLLDLIDEVLDLARIESGKVDLQPVSQLATAVVDDALVLILPLARKRNIQIHSPPHGMPLTVMADRMRLKQILINLLSNAVKYNNPEGSITITLHETHSQVGIAITDTGRGISPDELGKLFEPFVRLGDINAAPGVGIGLSISRRFVELMGGRIEVTSMPLKGSTFTLWLPRGDEALSIEAPTLPPPPVAKAANALNVLYIEDNPDNRQLMARIFDQHPLHRLHLASTGQEGILRALELLPDLILLDLQLPDINGYDIKRALSAAVDTACIPVVALTANALDSDRRQAHQLGFHGFLTKPVLQGELLDCLAKCAPISRP